uniref:Alpha-carbonic anhydrase domain-containing protein n=1 Tax=Monopterus albus TaxID=43700 RepID=A0A3Q3PZ11_MONAL
MTRVIFDINYICGCYQLKYFTVIHRSALISCFCQHVIGNYSCLCEHTSADLDFTHLVSGLIQDILCKRRFKLLSFCPLSVKGLVGQSEWSKHFPDCGGTSQSPVDVVTTQTKYDSSLIPLTPLGYSQHGNKPFTLYNNGHTVVIEMPEWMGLGGLPWLFTAVQLEHTINGLSADAELHVVHYNSELYPNMSTAMTQKDGLAVLGILIVTGKETNPAFNNILNYLSRIRHADQKVLIPGFDVQSLLPKDLGRYYRYNGSLTTPPCYQSVIWTLFHERVQISQAQFQNVMLVSKMRNNDKLLP